jgi:hypothetical protein
MKKLVRDRKTGHQPSTVISTIRNAAESGAQDKIMTFLPG